MALLGNIQKKRGQIVYTPGSAGVPASPAVLAQPAHTSLFTFSSGLVRLTPVTVPTLTPNVSGLSGYTVGTTQSQLWGDIGAASGGWYDAYSLSGDGSMSHYILRKAGMVVAEGNSAVYSLGGSSYAITISLPSVAARAAVIGQPATPATTTQINNTGWNAQAPSFGVATADFIASYTYCESTGCFMGVGPVSMASIEHGFYASRQSAYVSENQLPVGFSFPVYTGDVLTIERTGSVITYAQNGTPVYTSLVHSIGTKCLRADLYSAGDQITAASISTIQRGSVRGSSAMVATTSRALKATGINRLQVTAFVRLNHKVDAVALAANTATALVNINLGLYAQARGLTTMVSATASARMAGTIQPLQGYASSGRPVTSMKGSLMPVSGYAFVGRPIPANGAWTFGYAPAVIGAADMLPGSIGSMSGTSVPADGFASCRPSLSARHNYAVASGSAQAAVGYAFSQPDLPVRILAQLVLTQGLFTALRKNSSITFGAGSVL